MKTACLTLALLLAATASGAQEYLNCHFVPGWEKTGPSRDYASDNLFDYKDGGAEGYLSFGFVRMQGIDCKSGGDTLSIDVSQMSDPDAAYGLFNANLDPSLPVEKLGMGGQIQRQSASFARGNYYVELVMVAANPDSDQSPVLKAFAGKMLELLAGRDTLPEILGWFPKENLASARLVPESVLGLKQLKRGYVAKYAQGQAFIVPETSPESAAEVLKALRLRFEGSTPAPIGDEGFQAQAKSLDGICIFRKGRYLAGYANLPTPQGAAAAATRLLARLP